MASKYSTLPDIDDQPDVYETPDSNENAPIVSFENQSSDDDDNESVVKSRVSVKDAANRFKSSIVDSTDIDFSDRLTRRKKAMYRTYVRRPPAMETSEYEILPKDLSLDETPLQKLRRLMFEVQELNDEMEKAKVKHLSSVVKQKGVNAPFFFLLLCYRNQLMQKKLFLSQIFFHRFHIFNQI
ncbi:Dynamitin-domain-containing protein [Mucor mucedo]|uniref:Dynamitin-domain-containing protein n=1 Tax=Mucor mucedo TaxID=29922 RepID=UPI00221E3F6B|nr:Dynamitin-domain-containing protein [Mucor mucedo]KAI7891639.1 Dynamitin-domain-containing protein [Mucor mucedo]